MSIPTLTHTWILVGLAAAVLVPRQVWLHKAIRVAFGKWALVQRCQCHKVQNVVDHLPKDMEG